jgi:hypothetical protein
MPTGKLVFRYSLPVGDLDSGMLTTLWKALQLKSGRMSGSIGQRRNREMTVDEVPSVAKAATAPYLFLLPTRAVCRRRPSPVAQICNLSVSAKMLARCANPGIAAPPRWAVSRFCNPQGVASSKRVGVAPRFAECNSAIRQIANLRYSSGAPDDAYSGSRLDKVYDKGAREMCKLQRQDGSEHHISDNLSE